MTKHLGNLEAGFERVSGTKPCPICKKTDWCMIAVNRQSAICPRVQEGCVKNLGQSGYLHRLVDPAGGPKPYRGKPSRSGKSQQRKPIDWQERCKGYQQALANDDARLRILEDNLQLPRDCFGSLGVGSWGLDGTTVEFTFPMRNDHEEIVGCFLRICDWKSGKSAKKCISGSNMGLFIPQGWRDKSGPILIPEGASDTLALVLSGIIGIGRASAQYGGVLVASLLRNVPKDQQIVVMAENDQKEDGSWPGRDGAEKLAKFLAMQLDRAVLVAYPPDGAKDVRAWFIRSALGHLSWEERGKQFLTEVLKTQTLYRPDSEIEEDVDDPATWKRRPDNPRRLAEVIRAGFLDTRYRDQIRSWRGHFYEFKNGHYQLLLDDFSKTVCGRIDSEFFRVYKLEYRVWQLKSDEESKGSKPVVRPTSRGLTNNVLDQLHALTQVGDRLDPPVWLADRSLSNPQEQLCFPNGRLDLKTYQFEEPDPDFFTLNGVDYDFEPCTPPPRVWLGFLNTVWPDDTGSIAVLQEFMGYLLTADTSLQKMLVLLGPRRSGKGTILRMLKSLVGHENVASPTLASLGTQFGPSALIGKTVATIGETRESAKMDTAVATATLLSITGEDTIQVDRKYLPIVATRFRTRFVIACNSLPHLLDDSGALAGRMIILRMKESFEGREDPELEQRLHEERLGILFWAIDGLRRLRARGYFVESQDGRELRNLYQDSLAPCRVFVQDCCEIEASGRVFKQNLFSRWKTWCEERNENPGSEILFGRSLMGAFPKLRTSKQVANGPRIPVYVGIRLKTQDELSCSSTEEQSVLPAQAMSIAQEYKDSLWWKCPGWPGCPGKSLLLSLHGRGVSLVEGEEEYRQHIRKYPDVPDISDTEPVPGASDCVLSDLRDRSVTSGSGSGLVDHPGPAVVPGSEPIEIPPLTKWLYVSREFELEWVPLTQTQTIIDFGDTRFYRLAPEIVVWLKMKLYEYQKLAFASSPDHELQGQILKAVEAVGEASEFVAYYFAETDKTQIQAMEQLGCTPSLPEPEIFPDLR